MKPFILCHMMASLDGRIDCDMLEKYPGGDCYYVAVKVCTEKATP